jgi:hypothetical protein
MGAGDVVLPPLSVGERDMASLHLDHGGAAVRHEEEQVDLDLAVTGVGDSHSVEQDVAVAQASPEGIPYEALRLVLEMRMLGNEQCWHVPPFKVVSRIAGTSLRARSALLKPCGPRLGYGRAFEGHPYRSAVGWPQAIARDDRGREGRWG